MKTGIKIVCALLFAAVAAKSLCQVVSAINYKNEIGYIRPFAQTLQYHRIESLNVDVVNGTMTVRFIDGHTETAQVKGGVR